MCWAAFSCGVFNSDPLPIPHRYFASSVSFVFQRNSDNCRNVVVPVKDFTLHQLKDLDVCINFKSIGLHTFLYLMNFICVSLTYDTSDKNKSLVNFRRNTCSCFMFSKMLLVLLKR